MYNFNFKSCDGKNAILLVKCHKTGWREDCVKMRVLRGISVLWLLSNLGENCMKNSEGSVLHGVLVLPPCGFS